MKRLLSGMITAVVLMFGATGPVVVGDTVPTSCGGVETSLVKCDDTGEDNNGGAIWAVLKIVVQVLTYGVAILAAVGIVISGIQYTTAGDSSEKVAAAKRRIFEIVLGVLAYVLIATLANFLIPGGVFR